jgi:protein NrfD
MTAVELPSTLFTSPPHWHWLIVLYFFVGGLAGGCFFLAALIDLFGRPQDRPLARLGYYVAFPAVLVSALLLILDLTRPERFWHMMLESKTWQPMFKPWSPISIGVWALLVFGAFAFAGFLAALAEGRHVRWGWLTRLRPPGTLGGLVAGLGALLGLYVAGYTGVLLAVSNRPIWSDTHLLGFTFLVSAASTSIALLILLGESRRLASSGIASLRRMDAGLLVVELLALIALVASLGGLARLWLNAWGALLFVGVVLVGILAPLFLHWRPRTAGTAGALASALLVLVGGFILRLVIVLSSEGLGKI